MLIKQRAQRFPNVCGSRGEGPVGARGRCRKALGKRSLGGSIKGTFPSVCQTFSKGLQPSLGLMPHHNPVNAPRRVTDGCGTARKHVFSPTIEPSKAIQISTAIKMSFRMPPNPHPQRHQNFRLGCCLQRLPRWAPSQDVPRQEQKCAGEPNWLHVVENVLQTLGKR